MNLPGRSITPISVTVEDACTMTGLSDTKIRRLLIAGEIVGKREGRRILISVQALQDYYNSLPSAVEGAA